MANNITVRFATPDDLDFARQDGHASAEAVRRKIECREVAVAERSGRPAGYLRLEYLWTRVPYVAMIQVLPGDRRHGVGRAMLRFVEGFLRDRGHEAIYSSSMADEPEPQAWHRHMGFEECGFIAGVNAGGVGEVFFRKRLR